MNTKNTNAVLESVARRFTSTNSVPVERAHITADEWVVIQEFHLNLLKENKHLKQGFEKQKNAALSAVNNAKKSAQSMLHAAEKLYAESNPDAIESEQKMNAQLTDEVERLENKVEYLTEMVNSLQENS